jgi:hypothetical protein
VTKHCDRCGCSVKYEFIDFKTVMAIYQIFGAKKMCYPCGDKTDSFISYYGVKKREDIQRMRVFIQSGSLLKSITESAYSQLVNAGYNAQ